MVKEKKNVYKSETSDTNTVDSHGTDKNIDASNNKRPKIEKYEIMKRYIKVY